MAKVLVKQPDFAGFDPSTVVSTLEQKLATQREAIQIIETVANPSWDNVMAPLEALGDEIDRFWSPVGHLNSVMNGPDIREAYNDGLALLSAWYTDLGQNRALFEQIQAIRDGAEWAQLDAAQQKVVENALRDFRLGGVSLGEEEQARFKAISLRLTELKSQFEESLLDCTNAWKKPIENEAQLRGLPDSALAMARQYAKDNDQEASWMLGLEFPIYYAVLTYADDRALREEVYRAYNTRASDQGPHEKKYRNDSIIDEILRLRHEKAQILGFSHYASLSTETKMVDDPEAVITFLEELVSRAKPVAESEFTSLQAYARDNVGIDDLQAWDVAYVSEKQKQAEYAISDEDLKPYFPADRAVEGMFAIVKRLYGIEIAQNDSVSAWHDDVAYYEISDSQGALRGAFYLDRYARANKRGGAWMGDCVTRYVTDGGVQIPIAYLTCNLTPPTDDLPALLTHDEVITLFHEFGHG
ncbi:MAG: M3 family metallopeptidase, partial [Pseudomonadota bacterium]